MGRHGTFVILACACVIANIPFGNTQFQSSFGQNTGNNRFQSQQSSKSQYQQTGFGNQNSQRNQQSQYQGNQNQLQRNQQSQYGQNRFQQNQYQPNLLQEQSARQNTGYTCKEKNERYPIPSSCDRYVECINGTAEEKLCPDGLRFNPNVNFNVYPCQYPNVVQCLERSALQPPQPTDDCPNQFGYFKIGDARNCSSFRNCVNGVGYDFTCPEGLAFNSETYQCDWPDMVADCDAEAFLGFRCPDVPISKELGPPAGFRFYRSDQDCQKYFICIDGRPRRLGCGGDAAFDELTSTCVLADEVDSCPPELRAIAARSREAEKQRLEKELQFKSAPLQQKKRF